MASSAWYPSDAFSAQWELAHDGLAVMLGLFGLYILSVPWLGYFSSTLLFLVASSRVLGIAWPTTWALSLPLALVMWWVFSKLLKVHFGHGWLI